MKSIEVLILDYKKWVSTFLNLWPKQPSLAAEEINGELKNLVALDGKLLPKGLSVKPDTLKKWSERGSVPSQGKWLEALVICVERSVKQAPEGLETNYTFKELLERIQYIRLNPDRLADTNDLLVKRGIIRFFPKASEELDLSAFGLTSSAAGGQVPEYVSRKVDAEIISRLNDPNSKYLVLAGKSKAGKTRSVLECLQRSNKRSRPVYVLSNTPGSIGEFVRIMRLASAKDIVIILDDIHRFQVSLDPRGLNLESFTELSQLGTVVATIDVARFRAMEAENMTPSTGSTYQSSVKTVQKQPQNLQGRIVEKTLVMEANLEEQELQRAIELFGMQFSGSDLLNLGAFFSSGEKLLNSFSSLADDDLLSISIHDGILLANLLFPLGFESNILEGLIRSEFEKKAPNGLWQELVYQEKLLRLTVGSYSGSPHTVLVRSDDQIEKLRLHDYVWERFHHLTPSIDYEVLKKYASPQAAENAYQHALGTIAFQIIRQYLDSNPKDAAGHSVLAGFLFTEGLIEESLTEIKIACELDPDDSEAFFNRIETECVLGRLKEAEALLRIRRDTNRSDYVVRSYLIEVLSRLGRTEELVEISEELGIDEQFSLSMKELTQGFVFSKIGQFEKSKDLYEGVLRRDPDSCDASTNLVAVLQKLNQLDQAVKVGRAHTETCTKLCNTWANLGNIYIDLRMLEDAQKLKVELDKEKFASAEKFNFFGRLMWSSGDLEGAVGEFRQATILAPWDPTAHANLGDALGQLGKLDEAELCFTAGLELDPKSDQCLAGLGSVFYMKEDLYQSSAYLSRAIETERRAHTLFLAARVSSDLGDCEYAVKLFKEAMLANLEKKSTDEQPWHYQYYSDCLINLGFFDAALEIMKIEYEKFPSHEILLNFCDLLRLQGRAKEALELIEAEISKTPSDSHLHLVLAKLLENELNFRDAIGVLESIGHETINEELRAIQIASLEVQLGEFNSALKTLAPFWKIDHENEKMHGLFLAAMRASGESSKATSLERDILIRQGSESMTTALISGDYLAKNFKSLKRRVTDWILHEGEAPDALEMLGEIALSDNEIHQAAETFKKALNMDPSRIYSAIGLFEAHLKLGDSNRAVAQLISYRQNNNLTTLAHQEIQICLDSVDENNLVGESGTRQYQPYIGSGQVHIRQGKEDQKVQLSGLKQLGHSL